MERKQQEENNDGDGTFQVKGDPETGALTQDDPSKKTGIRQRAALSGNNNKSTISPKPQTVGQIPPYLPPTIVKAATTDENEAERRLRNRIMSGTFRPMHDVSPPISPEASQLIKQLLEVSPTDRLTVDEALASPWMTMK